MDEFLCKVKNYIIKKELLTKGDKVVLGVSGGADSVCLFDCLYKLKDEYDLELFVVHVNHGLRQEAKEEEEYVKDLCEERKISFYLKSVDLNALSKQFSMGTEEAGRKVRYDFFNEIKLKTGATKISVAHNKNDRAETMLFNLVRGTGPKGLASIEPKRDDVIRPLLNSERSEIEEYLKRQSIKYYTDMSNFSSDYQRNRIRNNVIPVLKAEILDSAVGHMATTADQMTEINDFLKEATDFSFAEALIKKSESEVTFNKELFLKNHNYIQKLLVKKSIDELVPNNKDITHLHIEAVTDLLKKSGSKYTDLPYGIKAESSYDTLSLKRDFTAKENPLEGIKFTKEIFDFEKGFDYGNLKYSKCFDCDKINESLMLRTRKTGDEIVIDEKGSRKKLKDYMINEKIPAAVRDEVPIFAIGKDVVWVVGYRMSEAYKITENTKRILRITVFKEE